MPLFPKRFFPRLVRFITGRSAETTQDVYINGIAVGRAKSCFFVAEIGINHNGSIEIAKKLIDVAKDAGAQAVKFQKRTVPVVYSVEELAKLRAVDRGVLENAIKRGVLSKEAVERLKKSDFKDSTNGDLKWALEFTEAEYREIDRYSKEKGIFWFASPWDEASVDFLEKLNPPCHKVASAMLTHTGILRKLREAGKPVIASTGMSTMEEVKNAVNLLSGIPLVLLHTVSTYPAKEEEVNLRTIAKFRQEFPKIPIGYSGHEQGIAATLAAATLGAHVIERHITLDKKMFGTDQSASLEPQEFGQVIKEVREIEKAWGDGVKRVWPSEIPIKEKLRKV
ncbi:MAG: N-acetylneuraminate synthase family protein [Patescibacteria group bacterium]